MPQNVPDFPTLLRSARRTAVHLEMRDSYSVAGEAAEFEQWKRTGQVDLDPDSEGWSRWVSMVREATGRGVVMRRARIVSEPVSEYIKYEHATTAVNVAVGEQVRWLPRRRALGIAVPAADFWLFDGRLVRFNLFAGDGGWADPQFEVTEDPAVAQLCSSAFDAVWERAIPHEEYKV
ncbi:DUF6879 family protein [Streptomyces huiliensis]|uniref:DUF6879 family protein n=1 Tax=Streptomyces huiliensis TaxID=2876027 RepID=UPI001CBEE4B0|nr:DUF6879 family protein [Streptomyces huiliensis]MBZ4318989.1 hypothetical protein [Streptomyces huiliensis]